MAHSFNSRDHSGIVRRPVVVLVSAVAALFLGVPSAPAATVTATMPGFTAEFVATYPAPCGGEGPTAMAELNGTIYMAAEGRLYYKRPGIALAYYGGDRRQLPWGLTVLGGRMYGTTPACGAEPTTDPVNGSSNCNVVSLGASSARGTNVAPVCGFGIAADPRTSTLTVAQRDGSVVSVNPSGGAVTPLFTAQGARRLAWSEDGARLYVGFEDGAVRSWERAGALRPVATGARGLAAGTSEVNLAGSALIGAGGGVRAVPGGDVAAIAEHPSALVSGPDGLYVGLRGELWLLRGRYSPPPPPARPPPSTPPPTVAQPRVAAPTSPGAPPPVVPPQAPPPPPPPAPPVPPLATAAQVAAQPSAVANPAIVPGDQEREAALRLAATRREDPLAPTMLWLALAGAVCLGGFTVGRFGASRSRKDSLAFCQQRSR